MSIDTVSSGSQGDIYNYAFLTRDWDSLTGGSGNPTEPTVAHRHIDRYLEELEGETPPDLRGVVSFPRRLQKSVQLFRNFFSDGETVPSENKDWTRWGENDQTRKLAFALRAGRLDSSGLSGDPFLAYLDYDFADFILQTHSNEVGNVGFQNLPQGLFARELAHYINLLNNLKGTKKPNIENIQFGDNVSDESVVQLISVLAGISNLVSLSADLSRVGYTKESLIRQIDLSIKALERFIDEFNDRQEYTALTDDVKEYSDELIEILIDCDDTEGLLERRIPELLIYYQELCGDSWPTVINRVITNVLCKLTVINIEKIRGLTNELGYLSEDEHLSITASTIKDAFGSGGETLAKLVLAKIHLIGTANNLPANLVLARIQANGFGRQTIEGYKDGLPDSAEEEGTEPSPVITVEQVLDRPVFPAGQLRAIIDRKAKEIEDRIGKPTEIDINRFLVLKKIQESWPGKSRFAVYRGKIDIPEDEYIPITIEPGFEDYVLLVLEEVQDDGKVVEHVIAESPVVGRSALYILRGDVTEEEWEDVFARSRYYARGVGVKRLLHRTTEGSDSIETMTIKVGALLSANPEDFKQTDYVESGGRLRIKRHLGGTALSGAEIT